MDDLDLKLIMELQNEKYGRNAAIAKKLKISQATVSRRINRLLQDKVIRIISVPDIKAVGYNAIATIAIDADIKKIDSICDKLASYSNVHTVATAFGRFDIIISVYFATMEMLADFVRKELAHIDGVIDIETFYISEIKKLTFGWLPK